MSIKKRDTTQLLNSQNNDSEEYPYEVTIPGTREGLEDANTLNVIDKKTGKIAYTMDKITYIELIYGVNLKIKATELTEWLKVKYELKKLTKEQSSRFMQIFSETATSTKGVFARSDIFKIIDIVRGKKKKPAKIRQSGHFTDSKLQHSTNEKPSPATQKKIEELSVTTKVYGSIKLTPAEDKLINSIFKLLHDKSENKDLSSDSFYSGNEQSKLVLYGGKKENASVLRIKPAELYKEYLGQDRPSGKGITNVKNLLLGLSEKKFLIRYDRKRKVTKNKKEEILTDRIEDVQSLINIMSYIEGLTEKEVKRLDSGDMSIREKKGELIIALNPLLTDQIKTKYVEYPEDINQRTIIAAGGTRKVTVFIINLRDYLLREISAGRKQSVINENTLIKQIGLDKYISSGRKGLVFKNLNNAIQACKRIGVISDLKKETSVQGQVKYIFDLNKDF